MPVEKFQTLQVPSSMGPIAVQVQWARHCGARAIYLLDGMRASSSENGWVANTTARAQFGNDDVTLVMPIGGQGSWYADWAQTTLDGGQPIAMRWETFLAGELPDYLSQFGVSRNDNAVIGLSMSASTALTLLAHHRDRFAVGGAFSGALDWRSADMREAIRIATMAVGRNPNDLAAPGSDQWNHLDPMTSAPLLAGAAMYIAAGSGVPSTHDVQTSPVEAWTGVGLELITAASTHRFKSRLDELGIAARYHFPATGSHNWLTWDQELAQARPWLLEHLDLRSDAAS